MARRDRVDPEALLREHFAAEREVARRELPPLPRFDARACARNSRAKTPTLDRPRAERPLKEKGLSLEWAAAAALALAFGLGVAAQPTTSLSLAVAENAFERGIAREVGTIFDRGLSAAIAAFGESARAGAEDAIAIRNNRFR